MTGDCLAYVVHCRADLDLGLYKPLQLIKYDEGNNNILLQDKDQLLAFSLGSCSMQPLWVWSPAFCQYVLSYTVKAILAALLAAVLADQALCT